MGPAGAFLIIAALSAAPEHRIDVLKTIEKYL